MNCEGRTETEPAIDSDVSAPGPGPRPRLIDQQYASEQPAGNPAEQVQDEVVWPPHVDLAVRGEREAMPVPDHVLDRHAVHPPRDEAAVLPASHGGHPYAVAGGLSDYAGGTHGQGDEEKQARLGTAGAGNTLYRVRLPVQPTWPYSPGFEHG